LISFHAIVIFSFEGFWPEFPTQYPNEFLCAMVHMNPKNINGRVTLKSANPRDTPDINMGFFSKGDDEDLQAMFEAAGFLRPIFNKVPNNTFSELHPCTHPNCTDAEQKEFLRNQIFSHHVSSSCAIGADDDKMAVLDLNFEVRGVKNLRVVDASAFLRVPGAFPVLSTFIISEKAADVILKDVK
jgi:choline dehydrogenase